MNREGADPAALQNLTNTKFSIYGTPPIHRGRKRGYKLKLSFLILPKRLSQESGIVYISTSLNMTIELLSDVRLIEGEGGGRGGIKFSKKFKHLLNFSSASSPTTHTRTASVVAGHRASPCLPLRGGRETPWPR